MVQIQDTSNQDQVLEKQSLTLSKPMIVTLVALGLLMVWIIPNIINWSKAEHSVSIDRIRVATVERTELVRDVSVQGRLVAATKPTLYSPAQGVVDFKVQAGDTVEQNEVLAVVNSPELTSQFDQAKSMLQQLQIEYERQQIQSRKQALLNQKSVDQAQMALTSARREMRRAKEAWDKQAISKIDLERAEDELEQATLTYNHAVQDLKLNKESLNFEDRTRELRVNQQQILVTELQRQVEQLNIRSTVSGVVGNLLTEPMNAVSKHQPLMTVVDLSDFEVELQVPETYSDDLGIGMPAEVINGNEIYQAEVISISPEVQNNMVQCRLKFVNQSPSGLRQNQRLTSRILLESIDNVLTVQRGQFLESGQGRVAYVIKDNVAHRTAIETGSKSLSKVQVVAGLQEGDQLIISSVDSFEGAETVLLTQ